MKRVLSIILTLTMLLSLGTTAFAADNSETSSNDRTAVQSAVSKIDPKYVEEYESLSPTEKDIRLKVISSTYTMSGQVLSESDSAFIILSRWESENNPQPKSGAATQWYDVYKTQYGVKVNLYGTMRQDICFIAGSSRYGGTATAWIQSGSVSRVDLAIHHTAYGLIGTSAPFVGVLYNGSVSMSKSGNSTSVRMDKETEYGSILPLYTTMYASGTINTASGDEFTITSDTWTAWQ